MLERQYARQQRSNRLPIAFALFGLSLVFFTVSYSSRPDILGFARSYSRLEGERQPSSSQTGPAATPAKTKPEHPPAVTKGAAAPANIEVLRLHRDDWPLPSSPGDSERYLTYLPHSGFHNQRISLQNALVLATLLNRTLLAPPVTIGASLNWHPSGRLLHDLEIAEASNLRDCRVIQDSKMRAMKCGSAWDSIRASWSWLLDAKRVSTEHRVITRSLIHRDWMMKDLKLQASDVYTFPDPQRYSHQIYDDPDDPTRLVDFVANFTHRIDLPDLQALDDWKLLEFGSLFGRTRLVLRSDKHLNLYARTEKMMAFSEPMLDEASEAIADRLGGRDSYFALHLRVGHGDRFEENARGRSAGVFKSLCKAFGLSSATTDVLLRQNRQDPGNPSYIPPTLPLPDASTLFSPSPELSCPHALYAPTSPLAALNRPLYLATDASSPRTTNSLALFRNTFPCLFFLDDFRAVGPLNDVPVKSVERLATFVGDRTREPLERFLAPFVEAEVVAKSRVALGTPGSTFSSFATGTLFDAYHEVDP